jgi:hypothetical protein
MKFHEDEISPYSTLSKIAGVSKEELGAMELMFLEGIQFKVFVEEGAFESYKQRLQNYSKSILSKNQSSCDIYMETKDIQVI